MIRIEIKSRLGGGWREGREGVGVCVGVVLEGGGAREGGRNRRSFLKLL